VIAALMPFWWLVRRGHEAAVRSPLFAFVRRYGLSGVAGYLARMAAERDFRIVRKYGKGHRRDAVSAGAGPYRRRLLRGRLLGSEPCKNQVRSSGGVLEPGRQKGQGSRRPIMRIMLRAAMRGLGNLAGRGMMASEEEPPGKRDGHSERLQYIESAVGRVTRLLAYVVIVPALPILLCFMFLPKTSSVTMFLSHGDFAVLAVALTAAAIAEVLGPEAPKPWARNLLVTSCFILLLLFTVLLAGIAGDASRLTPPLDAVLSLVSFGLAVFAAVTAWAVTTRRQEGMEQAPGGEHK
jgi:hypothetical protein